MYSSRWKLCLSRQQQQQLYHLDCIKMQSQGEYSEKYLPNSFVTCFLNTRLITSRVFSCQWTFKSPGTSNLTLRNSVNILLQTKLSATPVSCRTLLQYNAYDAIPIVLFSLKFQLFGSLAWVWSTGGVSLDLSMDFMILATSNSRFIRQQVQSCCFFGSSPSVVVLVCRTGPLELN